jgi:hypothetical protein
MWSEKNVSKPIQLSSATRPKTNVCVAEIVLVLLPGEE